MTPCISFKACHLKVEVNHLFSETLPLGSFRLIVNHPNHDFGGEQKYQHPIINTMDYSKYTKKRVAAKQKRNSVDFGLNKSRAPSFRKCFIENVLPLSKHAAFLR